MNSNRQNYRYVDMPRCCMTCAFRSNEFSSSIITGIFNCANVKYDYNSHSHVIYDRVEWNYVCDNYKSNKVI